MSLLHRNPERVGSFLQIVSEYVAIIKPQYENLYNNKKDANHPATFDEFWQNILPEFIGRKWVNLIQTTIEPATHWQGIYELDGDVLKLAFSGRPDVRPESFATKVGVAGFCFTLKRIKD